MAPKKIRFTTPKKTVRFNSNVPTIFRKPTKCWICCEPLCYGFIAISVVIAIIFLAAVFVTLFPVPLQKLKMWIKHEKSFTTYQSSTGVSSNKDISLEMVPCKRLTVHKVWSKAISRLNSETPVRKVDLNGDVIDDIVIGFGIGGMNIFLFRIIINFALFDITLDEFFQYNNQNAPRCQFSSEQEIICEGGLIAFDGATGDTIWQRWTTFTLFSLFCSTDLTKDGVIDCIGAGRGGLIIAINGKTGDVIWEHREAIGYDDASNPYYIDLYTINPIRDLDGDLVTDVLSAHVEESETKKMGHIKIISGVNGITIRTIPTPHREEVFVPLQFVTKPDGTELLLIITGGQSTPGGLYTIRLSALMHYFNEVSIVIWLIIHSYFDLPGGKKSECTVKKLLKYFGHTITNSILHSCIITVLYR